MIIIVSYYQNLFGSTVDITTGIIKLLKLKVYAFAWLVLSWVWLVGLPPVLPVLAVKKEKNKLWHALVAATEMLNQVSLAISCVTATPLTNEGNRCLVLFCFLNTCLFKLAIVVWVSTNPCRYQLLLLLTGLACALALGHQLLWGTELGLVPTLNASWEVVSTGLC